MRACKHSTQHLVLRITLTFGPPDHLGMLPQDCSNNEPDAHADLIAAGHSEYCAGKVLL